MRCQATVVMKNVRWKFIRESYAVVNVESVMGEHQERDELWKSGSLEPRKGFAGGRALAPRELRP